MFLNILESWDSFKKNGCLESEPTLKMNLTSWTFTSFKTFSRVPPLLPTTPHYYITRDIEKLVKI